MSSVFFANSFMASTSALASRDRKIVDSTVMEFARGSKSKGLRLHKLKCRESRFYSISANKDLRVIVLIDGDIRVVMHAGHHDAAYRWADRHEVRAHEVTGVPQIIEYVEEVEKRIRFIDEGQESRPLFNNIADEQLAGIGVPSDYLRLVRKVCNENDLEQLSGALPEEAWEALVDIAAGAEPDVIIAGILQQLTTDPLQSDISGRDISHEFTSQFAKRRFWFADSEQALEKAMSMPWAAWRVFLHPSQAAAVEASHNGPAKVTGGAGTGKSVVLVHRAARLIQQSTNSRVLLSTFSKVLAEHLAKSVDELIGSEPTQRSRVAVIHLHEHAYLALRVLEPSLKMATTANLRERLDLAIADVGYLALPAAFVRDEWQHVVDYWGVESLESYLKVSRIGRGKPLKSSQRELIWPVFRQVLDGLKTDHSLTRAAICEHASKTVDENGPRYEHVLLDEAQDFGPRELRYAHALAGSGKNALFLGGDDGQRIYQNPFSLKSVGINIRGRSRRLRVNYRTSAEIHDFSVNILPNENGDDDESLSRRVTSLFGGISPKIVNCQSRKEETDRVIRWVVSCQESGIAINEIALLSRQHMRLDEIINSIESELGEVTTKLNNRNELGIVTDILHAAKGMEFQAVAVVGAEEGTLPLTAALNGEPGDEAHTLTLAREQHLLYVGCTRARENLMVTHHGERSRFLPKGSESLNS